MSNDTMDFLNANAGGSGYPSMKFENVGDHVVGTIEGLPRTVEGTNLDGEPEQSLVIDLAVTKAQGFCGNSETRADASTASNVTVWVKKGAMARAVRDALNAAGASGLEDGGTFALTHTELGEQKKAGYNRPKLYRAEYKSPVAAVAVGESLI